MFRGLAAVNLDAKGRITIPSHFRSTIMEEADGELVLSIDTEDRCLLLYPLLTWQKIESRIGSLPSLHSATRRIRRLLVGHATEMQVDNHGRILLPQLLRDYAHMDKTVMLVGQGKLIELWGEEQWHLAREQWLAHAFNAEDHTLPAELLELTL